MTAAIFDCISGASGDMFLGAWFDLGLISREAWLSHMSSLPVTEYQLDITKVLRKGITATNVTVNLEESKSHRHLKDIETIINDSALPEIVKARSKEAFRYLAEAEAKVHGIPAEKVHFHEVGAVDAIVDITGNMLAWYLVGQPDCVVSPIEVGGGTVTCAHGIMPVPAPATAILLEGFPTYSSGPIGETVTPTGACIIRTLAKPRDKRLFSSQNVGYGAGTHDLPMANVLRIQLGNWISSEMSPSQPLHQSAYVDAIQIETNIDDMSPEISGYVTERLLSLRVMECYWTPVTMKKGRPGVLLTVLCSPDILATVQEVIYSETSTIGMRCFSVRKYELEREIVSVDTHYGKIPVKLAFRSGKTVNVAPEYQVCKSIAVSNNVSIKQVYHAAISATTGYYDESSRINSEGTPIHDM